MFESCRGRIFRLAIPIPTRHRPSNANTSWDVPEPVAGRLTATDTVAEGAGVLVGALVFVGAVVVAGALVLVGAVVVVGAFVLTGVVVGVTDHWAYRVTLADNVRFDSAAMSSPVPSDAVVHPIKV